MKPRANPETLRSLAQMVRLKDGLRTINVESLIYQLEAAAADIEWMAEDLKDDREIIQAMAHDIAIRNMKALTGK